MERLINADVLIWRLIPVDLGCIRGRDTVKEVFPSGVFSILKVLPMVVLSLALGKELQSLEAKLLR
jgi:hypothetical protein